MFPINQLPVSSILCKNSPESNESTLPAIIRIVFNVKETGHMVGVQRIQDHQGCYKNGDLKLKFTCYSPETILNFNSIDILMSSLTDHCQCLFLK